MTLILGQVSRHFVLQVSDRLVTRAGAEFDLIANKSILYRARNGIVVMSYTGPAYLCGIPTDQFLGEFLSGHQLRDPERPGAMIGGMQTEWLDVGPMLTRVTVALNNAFAQPMTFDPRPLYFQLMVIGWQWDRRDRARPILAWITKPAGAGVAELRYARTRELTWREFLAPVTPAGNLTPTERTNARERLRGTRAEEDAESALVDAIRTSIGVRNGYVGKDCLSVTLPPPRYAAAIVRFIPGPEFRGAVALGNIPIGPAAFSPWMISPGGTYPPGNMIGGGWMIELGGFTVRLDGPPVPQMPPGWNGPRVLAAWGGMVRRPEPPG